MLTLTQGSIKAYLFTSFLLFIISIILPTGIELGYIKPIPEVYSISETAISVSSGIYVSFNLFLDLIVISINSLSVMLDIKSIKQYKEYKKMLYGLIDKKEV